MTARRRNTLSPTLFPFLAVLVCTLGTLILLLALVAQQAKTNAQQQANVPAARDPHRLTDQEAAGLIEEEQFRVERLVAHRTAQTADLEQRRDRLTYLEAETDKLKQKLNRLRDEVEAATDQLNPAKVDEKALVLLRNEVDAEKRAVRELSESATGKQPRVIIVPHGGPNGTDRRAAYLECTAKGVTVWPENVTITPVQLIAAMDGINPLDAALRTIRLHALRHSGDQVAPYPLLLVRPDGTETYALARAAMRDWDDQFGYELVPDDVELTFPKPDEQLKKRLQVAIRGAGSGQSRMVAGMGGRGGRGFGPWGDDRRGFGERGAGGVPSGTVPSRRRLPTLSAAQMDRQGQARGYQRQDPFATGSGFDGRSDIDRMIDGLPEQTRELEAQGRLTQSQGTGQAESATPSDDSTRSVWNETLAKPENTGTRGSVGDRASPGDVASDDKKDSTEAGKPYAQDPPSLTTSTDPRTAAATRREGRSQSTTSAEAAREMAAGQSSSASRPSQMSLQPPQSQQQPPSVAISAQPPRSGQVSREGRDWAIPKHMTTRTGNAVVRTIRVRCHHDRYELMTLGRDRKPRVQRTFRFQNGDIEKATLDLATAVHDRVANWGTSLPGSHWQPKMEVDVMIHGTQRFHQLQTFMRDSGVDIVARKANADPPPRSRR